MTPAPLPEAARPATAQDFPEHHLALFTLPDGRVHLAVRPTGTADSAGHGLALAFARAATLSAATRGRPPDHYAIEGG